MVGTKCNLVADGKDEHICCFAKKNYTKNITYLLFRFFCLRKKEKISRNGGMMNPKVAITSWLDKCLLLECTYFIVKFRKNNINSL